MERGPTTVMIPSGSSRLADFPISRLADDHKGVNDREREGWLILGKGQGRNGKCVWQRDSPTLLQGDAQLPLSLPLSLSLSSRSVLLWLPPAHMFDGRRDRTLLPGPLLYFRKEHVFFSWFFGLVCDLLVSPPPPPDDEAKTATNALLSIYVDDLLILFVYPYSRGRWHEGVHMCTANGFSKCPLARCSIFLLLTQAFKLFIHIYLEGRQKEKVGAC